MKVCLTLICLFFLTLKDGDAVKTVKLIGENIRVGCRVSSTERMRLFCRENCDEEKNILVKTSKDRAESGRYTIEYESFANGTSILHMSIRDLKRSDTGRYQCGLYNPSSGRLKYADFDLTVNGATNTSDPNSTTSTFLSSTPKQKLSSIMPITIPQIKAVKPEGEPDPLLYAGVAVVMISLVISLTIYWWKKYYHQQNDSPVETENDDVSQTNPEREETKEDRQNNSSADELSSLYR